MSQTLKALERRFRTGEEHALLKGNPVYYLIEEKSIQDLKDAGEPVWWEDHNIAGSARDKLLQLRARPLQIIFYPDDLLIPHSFDKPRSKQVILLENDREALGWNKDGLFPRLPEIVQGLLQHFHATRIQLLGEIHDFTRIRTATPVDSVASVEDPHTKFVTVGPWRDPYGLKIDFGYEAGSFLPSIGAIRFRTVELSLFQKILNITTEHLNPALCAVNSVPDQIRQWRA